MVRAARHERRPLSRTPTLTRYFYRSLTEAARDRRLEPQDTTILYLAELLTEYGDARRLFDYDGERIRLPTLADLYRQAAESESRRERGAFLRRLGDVALFVAGLFPGYLERRVVGVDYYIAMGRNAYHYLDQDLDLPGAARARSPFSELASRFDGFVQVLSDLGQRDAGLARDDVGRGLQRWSGGQEGRLAVPAMPLAPPPARH